MNNKNIKTKHNSLLFTSIISLTFIFGKTSANAISNPKRFSGVNGLIRFYQSIIDKNSPTQSTTRPLKTNPSRITTNPTPIPTSTSNQTLLRRLPPVLTAKSSDIIRIYTTGSIRNTPNSNSSTNNTSTTNSHTPNPTTPNTSSRLNLTLNSNPNLQPLIYSKKDLKKLEREIQIFTAKTIKRNLPRNATGEVKLKFDKELQKDLNLSLSRFVYKSTMDSIDGYINDSE